MLRAIAILTFTVPLLFAHESRAQSGGDYCAQLNAYRVVIERSSLTSMKKREALLRQSQAIDQREKLRTRRSVKSLNDWCRESLIELRRKDGI